MRFVLTTVAHAAVLTQTSCTVSQHTRPWNLPYTGVVVQILVFTRLFRIQNLMKFIQYWNISVYVQVYFSVWRPFTTHLTRLSFVTSSRVNIINLTTIDLIWVWNLCWTSIDYLYLWVCLKQSLGWDTLTERDFSLFCRPWWFGKISCFYPYTYLSLA